MAIVARGTVADRPWGRTMSFVADRRFSGELVVDLDGKRYVVGFDHGAVVAAASPLGTDAAVRVALTAGLVTSSQVAEISRQVMARPDLDEVDAVADAARLGPDQADRLRRRVIAHKAIRGFALDRGDFVLTDERTLGFDPVHAIDVRALIFLGARTHMTEQRLLQELARVGPGFQLRADAISTLPQYGFSEAEKPVLAALRAAPVAVIDLDAAAPELDPRTVRAVAYALAVTNALDVAQSSVAHDRPRTQTSRDRSRPVSVPASRDVGSERGKRTSQIPAVRNTPSEINRRARISSDVDFETRTPSAATPIPRAGGGTRPPSEPGMRVRRTPTPPDRSPRSSTPPVGTERPRSGVMSTQSRSSRGDDRGDGPSPARTSSITVKPASEPRARPASASPPAATTRGRPASSLPIDNKAHRRPIRRTSTQPAYDAPGANEVRSLITARTELAADGADHFALLGIPMDASPEVVRRVYFTLARQLHPDRLTALGIEDTDRSAQRLFAQINTAFAVLSSPARRTEYARTMSQGGEAAVRAQQDQAEAITRRILAAEEAFRIGEMALRRDQLEVALEHFRRAVELNPDEADHHALLGWTIFAGAPDKNAVARESRNMLDRAARMAPKAVAPRLYLGRMARMMGRDREAMDYFAEVLALAPNHVEASSEMRLLEQRQGNPPPESGGGKAGLFSRRKKP
jgi:hypothetical protein